MADLGSFLTGVRVLDLSQYIPGPMASLFLADMGAHVTKIEPPDGDEMRHLGPRDDQGRPVFYRSMNGGKIIRRMNLKDEAARRDFLELVAESDIVLEGFRPGVMQRLGIDYPVLREANPSIILCSISGYGKNSTLRSSAGHDANYLALMGMLERNGSGRPAFFDPPISDVAGSLFAVTVMLGALHGRSRSGQGCEIDLALADTIMPLQMMQVADYGANRTVPHQGTTYLNGAAAYYEVYRTADEGFVVLGAVELKFWRAFCETAERPDWIERHGDTLPQWALKAELADWFGAKTRSELAETFAAADCCLTVVNDLGEALDQAQVRERQLVRKGPSGELQALFPVWIDGAPPRSRPAPIECETKEK
ncbi:crotonobetainyl-CoA:carnitine CoA-transferase CaiB-like acyl-CoA transferase [Mesorhizobium sp. J18]|uniref:CaiB/BaiF CoA transferase family protein n=1 Tax=Mesorhizobium sp. J18 TaxID=935263 RepID=UPI00119C2D45|nr:CoA transferase [Mesorhizobium sp. J18]TWG92807.1 crotonobetainyl-CoA:carnitine CoA-transferase CaiB-like acyl-CoA transferase [Mesorhizobium sp. J18]